MICLIDNYDSFTYNLYQYLGAICPDIVVVRNDQINGKDVKTMRPSQLVLSPGPGRPETAGICVELVREWTGKIPILGICLGHQAIGVAMGAKIDYAPVIVHGKQSMIYHQNKGILRDLPSGFLGGRYHSLVVKEEGLPDCLEIQAYTADRTIMALTHREHPTFGLQFHPESILTEYGKRLLRNFLNIKMII